RRRRVAGHSGNLRSPLCSCLIIDFHRSEWSIHDDAPDALALVHQVEPLVDVRQPHGVRDHRIDLDLALHVPVGASQLYGRRSLLSQTFAIGALMLPNVARGQVTETLPEVTVSAPRPAPVRRTTPAAAPARSASSRRVSAPAPSSPSSPAPAPQLPAFQAVATTPATGLGIDRDKVPAMCRTPPAADFSRDYSPNVVETFAQRIPGVTTNNVQGNEFATDLRYRGFAASPLQGTPQGLA